MTRLLEVHDLKVSYGRVEALFGVSLTVDAGQIVTVIGPNGAGKSTLLNAIAAVVPHTGTVTLDGLTTAGCETEVLAGRGLALVPERRDLFGSMTIQDNLQLGAYLHRGEGRKRLRERMEEVFTRFPRLAERRDQAAHTLSGGERQMLAIGRALMSRPRLLLLDEPSLGLAPLIVRDVFAAIETLRTSGVSILLVEQNARMALEIADRGYVLETGEIVEQGAGRDLLGNQRVMDTYLGIGRGNYDD